MTVRNIFLSLLILIVVSCSPDGKKDTQERFVPEKLEDLSGHSVAVLLGSVQDLLMTESVPDAKIVRLNVFPDLATSVSAGIVEYSLFDHLLLLAPEFNSKNLAVAIEGIDPKPIGAGFAKTPEGRSLCNQFNQFLSEIRDNGTFDQMEDRWLRPTDDPVMPDLVLPTEGDAIIVGECLDFFPLSFLRRGLPEGFEIELIERFSIWLGRPVTIQNYDFSGLIAALAVGKVDMIVADMCITEERQKMVLFSDPYIFGSSSLVYSPEIEGAKNTIKTVIHRNLIEEDRWKLFVNGLVETLYISIFSIVFGTILGGLVCSLRMSRRKFLSRLSGVYVELMHGLPMLVLLMILFYVIFTSNKVSPSWVAIMAFSINFSAYVSEMFRSGIEGVDKGQTEAGLALGFSRLKTFVYFVVPQAFKRIIPVYKGEVVSLVKGTSIVGYIAIQDLTKMSDLIRSRTFDAFFPLIIVSIIYLLLAWLIGLGLDALVRDKSTNK